MLEKDLQEKFLLSEEDETKPQSKMDEIMSNLNNWDPYSHQVFYGHTGAVWSTMSTCDNKFIFSGSEDKTIIIWNAETGLAEGKLEGHTSTVNALELTENDEFLISGAWDNSIRIWDWRNRTQISTLNGHTAGVYCFAISKDRKTLLSGAGDYRVRVWDLDAQAEVAALECGNSSVFGLALGKDGKNIIAGGWDSHLRFWNFDTKALITDHNCNSGVIQSLAVTSDSKFIVYGTRNNTVKVLNYEDRTEVMVFDVHNNWVRNLVTTSDSCYFITCSADKTMRVVNIKEKTEEFNLEGHEGYVFGLSLSKDGKFLLSGASDKTLRKWPIGIKSRVTAMRGHQKCIMSVAITGDNKYVISGAEDRSVRIWSIEEKTEVAVLNGHTDTVWGVAVTPNLQNIISVSGDKTLRVWDFAAKTELFNLIGHENPIFCVTVSHDSKLAASGAQDKLVIIWDLQTPKLIKKLEGHTDTVFTVKVTHDDKYIVSGAADYTIRIWSLEKLCLAQKIETKSGMIESVSLNHDDTLLVLGDRNSAVHLWDWKKKQAKVKFTAHNKWVKSVAFAQDGNLFATCSNDYSIRVWNAKEERQEFVLLGHGNTIRSVTFTNDSKYIVSGSEDLTVRLWDTENVQNLELADFLGPIDAFVFLSKIKLRRNPKLSMANMVLSSLRVNLAHIYCYLGDAEMLKKALELGTCICVNIEGRSPLYYALERNSQSCVDVVLNFLIDLKSVNSSRFLNFTNAIRDDFYSLIRNGSMYLPEFLEAVFYVADDQALPRFCLVKESLPIMHLSKSLKIKLKHFMPKRTQGGCEENPVEFKVLPIRINIELGSADSIELLTSLISSANSRILRTNLIQYIIQYKWSRIWVFQLFIFSLWLLNLIFLMLLILYPSLQDHFIIPFGILNGLLLLYDIIKAYSIDLNNFIEFWNILSIIRIGVSYVWIFMTIQQLSLAYYITWFLVLGNFLQGFSNMRIFKSTRFYTRLIFTTLEDAIPFIIMFIYSIVIMGLLHYCSNTESSYNFYTFWQAPYELNLSLTNKNIEPLEYVYIILASVFNIVLMLNLLIAVLGDSYDRLRCESVEIDSSQMVQNILEVENFMFWTRLHDKKAYLHVCQDPCAEHFIEPWEGKIKAITSLMTKYQEENKRNFKTILEKLKDLDTVKASCKHIEDKLPKK